MQDLRKASGLEVSDRIRLHVVGLDPIAEFFDFIAREVLAVEVVAGPGSGEGVVLELDDELLTEPVRVWIERVDVDDFVDRAGTPRQPGPERQRHQRRGSPGSSDPVSATWTPPVAAGSSTTRSASVRTIVHAGARRRRVGRRAGRRRAAPSRWVRARS